MRKLLIAVAVVACGTPAFAQADLTRASRGYTYFHRVGADMDSHDAAVLGCIDLAGRTEQPDQTAITGLTYGLFGLMLETTFLAIMNEVADDNGYATNVEDCMVVQGWTVMQIGAEAGSALAAGPLAERRKMLASWVGSETPEGWPVRQFSNDLLDPRARWIGAAGAVDKPSLSITAISRPKTTRPDREARLAKALAQSDKAAAAVGPVRDKALPDVTAAQTVFVVRMVARGKSTVFGFFNFEQDTDEMSRPIDLATSPSFAAATPGGTLWKKPTELVEKTYVYIVPPGRWRIERVSAVSLCLGAPAFDVRAGEAVFAGTFFVDGEGRLTPLLDQEPAKKALATVPAIAERLRPAQYVNGVKGNCGGAFIYALEAPGAPRVNPVATALPTSEGGPFAPGP